MDKTTKQQELNYLESVSEAIDYTKSKNKQKIKQNTEHIQNLKSFFADSFYDIRYGNGEEFVGEDEFANINISIENLQMQNNNLERETARLTKQKKNPYFGRFDFQAHDEQSPAPYYIGLGLIQNKDNQNLVYDWRADICSLYYENKMGKASYSCPEGEIDGEVSLKRQYKIENGEFHYYIDSNLVIDDEILMEQLSKNATTKMHDIVSTIQQEQNVLIRAEDFENTIVQGVAGSGKTSIAMHRVSYLLYKYRNKLKSEDILILSPSELFADYINEVLPALGEEKPFTTTFSDMAKRLLGQPFETREEMLERVISKQKQEDFENIAIKSSFEFLADLKQFLTEDMCNLFVPKTLAFGDVVISQEDIKDIYFNKLKKIPIFKRIEVLAESIAEHFAVPTNLRQPLIDRAKHLLYNCFITTDIKHIYNLFLSNLELEEIDEIGSYDIAPMLLIKENLQGLKNNFDAKYVIVDEMQDYTPCHFYLFEKIWKCAKLYLGDIYQSIDRTLQPEYLTHLAKLTHSKIKHLNKSYRSTLQISTFSQKILGKHIADNVNRHGDEVDFAKVDDCATEIEHIVENQLATNKRQSIAIICKTLEDIKTLQKKSDIIKKFKLLNKTETMSSAKKVITTPAMAKGVEFDCVIIPFADSKTYNNQLDRNLLYVSATRALHKLHFVCDKKPSKFLIKNEKK